MIDPVTLDRVCSKARALIRASGTPVTDEELQQLTVIDFGLGNVEREGVQTIDLLSTDRLRIKLLVLLPDQTLPQHLHPPYPGDAGKQETVRLVFGRMRVYLPGKDTMKEGFIVTGKEAFYTLRHEVVLTPVKQLTLKPGVEHWFQAGPEGAVTYSFYTQADEGFNRFADPEVTGVVGTPAGSSSRPVTRQ